MQSEYFLRSGYYTEASAVPGVGEVDGRFDIANDRGFLWEIKSDSTSGRYLGEKALANYTDRTGFKRGDDLPGFAAGSSVVLDGIKGNGVYRYTNAGNGLIVYERVGTQQPSAINIRVPKWYVLPTPNRRRDALGY